MNKQIKQQIKNGVLYGMGYVIGSHNLPDIKKRVREKIAKEFAEDAIKNIKNK